MSVVDQVLAHHGVKGMRWGVRRSRGGSSSSKGKTPASEDAARAMSSRHKVKSGGTKSLSNKELQDLVTRMNLEQQYKNLSKQTTTVQKGKKAAKAVLSVAGTMVTVYGYVNSPAGKALKQALTK